MSTNQKKARRDARKARKARKQKTQAERERYLAERQEKEDAEREAWGITYGMFRGWTRCRITEEHRARGLACNKAYCPLAEAFRDAGFTDVVVSAFAVRLDGEQALLPDDIVTLLRRLDLGQPVQLPYTFRVPLVAVPPLVAETAWRVLRDLKMTDPGHPIDDDAALDAVMKALAEVDRVCGQRVN